VENENIKKNKKKLIYINMNEIKIQTEISNINISNKTINILKKVFVK